MPEPITGFVHSVETAGTVDGPGLRFVVFMAGCPLRCLYCHNPDTHKISNGKETTVPELLASILRMKDFLLRTKGGLTVSGGEPLFQQDFVTELFKACKKEGIHTALDTSGFLGDKASDDLLAVTDLVLLDIKSFDATAHQKITGVKMQPCLDFAQKLARLGKRTWIRFVLVPGLTDDLPMIDAMGAFLSGLGNIEKVEVLPFHKMGEAKWKELGYPYTLSETQPPPEQLIEQVHAVFRRHGLTTQ